MFKNKYGPWALIVGGSEGIGREAALRLASQGINIALVARRRGPLLEAEQVIRAAAKVEVRTLAQDMSAPDMMASIKAFTKDIDVGFLIYNAGAQDRMNTFLYENIEAHLQSLRLSVEGPTRLCHHFGGLMRDRGRGGGIILVSSVSGLAGAYGLVTYGGVKAFEIMLAEGLWYEFQDFNISVLGAVIDMVRTPAFERMLGADTPFGQSPKAIADEILDSLEKGPTLYIKSLEKTMELLRTGDRATIVSNLAKGVKRYVADKIDVKRYDPNEVIQ